MRKFSEITCPKCGSGGIRKVHHLWKDDDTIVVYFSCAGCFCLFRVTAHLTFEDDSEIIEMA